MRNVLTLIKVNVSQPITQSSVKLLTTPLTPPSEEYLPQLYRQMISDCILATDPPG